MTGLKSETFEDVYRPQPHGFSSHPPPGRRGCSSRSAADPIGCSRSALSTRTSGRKTARGRHGSLQSHAAIIRVFKDVDAVHAKLINIKIGKGQESATSGSTP
jgi:hypothetical protein